MVPAFQGLWEATAGSAVWAQCLGKPSHEYGWSTEETSYSPEGSSSQRLHVLGTGLAMKFPSRTGGIAGVLELRLAWGHCLLSTCYLP